MIEQLDSFIKTLHSLLWGPVMILFLLGTGLFLTFYLKFIQFRGFPHAISLLTGKYDHHESPGDISHFQALSSALSATIGTGNIAGVATAIAQGGPGAVFWMWVSALLGMATKYTSCTLSLKYRRINPDGSVSGGPMYYLSKGAGFPLLGALFAFFTIAASFGIGNLAQANSVAKPLKDLYSIPDWMTGIFLSLITAMVILGGIKRIASVSSKVVPLMSIFYVGGALLILALHIDHILPAFKSIFIHAFNPTAAVGGFLGATVAKTVEYGIARGIFSNESGLGSAPIAHAAAKTKEPVREGLVASLEPFIDTIVISSMTALVILISGLWTAVDPETGKALSGTTLSAKAFDHGLPGYGKYIVGIGIAFFASSTILGWSYYGDRSVEYLFGKEKVRIYHWLWIFAIPLGAVMNLEMVWGLSDLANAMMAIPNLFGLLWLAREVKRDTTGYFKKL